MQNKTSKPWQLTKNEQFGMSLFFTLLVIFIILPWICRIPSQLLDVQQYPDIQTATNLNELNDSLDKETTNKYSGEKAGRNKQRSIQSLPSELFMFDPNQLNQAEAMQLGMTHHAFNSLQKYLETGAKITSKGQFRRIYGIDKQLYDRLENYIYIRTNSKSISASSSTKSKSNRMRQIDLNSAVVQDLLPLPSIGERLASRIIKYRDLLGGFASVNQLKEVYGLQDSVIQKLIPRVYLENELKPLKLNEANAELLSRHPYIGKFKARIILEYKKQHGNFNSLNDLLKIPALDSLWFEKIEPYLSIE